MGSQVLISNIPDLVVFLKDDSVGGSPVSRLFGKKDRCEELGMKALADRIRPQVDPVYTRIC